MAEERKGLIELGWFGEMPPADEPVADPLRSALVAQEPTDEQLERVRQDLLRRARLATRPARYGFQLVRRDREDGSIEYQIFADTKGNGRQIAWVQSSRHDAEFLQACLAQAPLFERLLALASVSASTHQEKENDDEKTLTRSHLHDDSGTATTEREK